MRLITERNKPTIAIRLKRLRYDATEYALTHARGLSCFAAIAIGAAAVAGFWPNTKTPERPTATAVARMLPPLGTTSVGLVQPDRTTIEITNGVISTIYSAGGSGGGSAGTFGSGGGSAGTFGSGGGSAGTFGSGGGAGGGTGFVTIYVK